MASPEEQQSTSVAVAALRQLRDDPVPTVARAARLALTRLPLTPDGQAALTVPRPIADDARAVLQGGVDEIDANPDLLLADRNPIFTAALVTAYLALVVERPQPGWVSVSALADGISRMPRFQPDIDGLLSVYRRVLDAATEDDGALIDGESPRSATRKAGAWVVAASDEEAEWLRRTLAWIVARAALAALVFRLAGELQSTDPFHRRAAAQLIADATQAVDNDQPPPLPGVGRTLGEQPRAKPMPNVAPGEPPTGTGGGHIVHGHDGFAAGDDVGDDFNFAGSPAVDRDVQFTVYKPLVVRPERWNQLLTFVHRSTPFVDDDGATVDPLAEVASQADHLLGAQRMSFTSVVADSAAALPRGDELVFEPWIEDGEVNPERIVLRWCEPIHRVEFKFRVPAQENGRRLRGAVRVFLGVIEVAIVSFAVNVDRTSALPAPNPPVAGHPYRRIFASYSHRDIAIVERVRASAAALGDRYMIDVEVLRAGEQWQQRLAELIEEADVFQLFWSHNSMHSAFVRREWEHALALGRPQFVRPLFWEDPRPADPERGLPPALLARLHFWRLAPALATLPEPPIPVASDEPMADRDQDVDPDVAPPPMGSPRDPRGDWRPRTGRGGIHGRQSARYSRGSSYQVRVLVLVIVVIVLVLLLAHPR